VNLAFQNNDPRFVEHVSIITAVCLGLWFGITLLQLSYQEIQAKIKDNSKHNTLIDFNLAEDTEKP
jgi:DNA-directed RNA polymerase specialized sigma54-like protein